MTKTQYLQAKTELRTASEAYYLGEDLLMDDATYDVLNREVEAAEATHPEWVEGDSVVAVAAGANVGGDVVHSQALLSLDNAMDEGEFAAWFSRTSEVCPGANIVLEPKLDGLAIAARYENGKLVQVITRGDGTSGEDVTYRGRGATGLPEVLLEPLTIELRGEVYMSDADFEEANEIRVRNGKNAFVNNRNGAAGALRNEKADYELPLSFACYDAHGVTGPHSVVMAKVRSLGATTAGALVGMADTYTTLEELLGAIRQLGTQRSTLGIPTDGAVAKLDDPTLREKLGVTSRSPRWAIAFKYPPEERFSTLLEVIAQVGKTGVITPRARIFPVEVGGVTVTYASMHNWIMVQERGWMIGDTVSVRRAGEVIPELVAPVVGRRDGTQTPIALPEVCPQCGSAIDKSEKRWRCSRGRACGLVELLSYAVSRDALDIEGLGEKLLGQLVAKGDVADVADLFDLTEAKLAGYDRMGEQSAANVIQAIAAARQASRARLFTALGIRGTGRSLSRRLAVTFGSLRDLEAATVAELAGVDGIGTEKSALIRAELDDIGDVIDKLVERGITGESAESDLAIGSADGGSLPLSGMTVVVTGAMVGVFADKSRNEMNELIESFGGKSSGSVSAKTSLVVVGEKAGSKATKAAELGVRVLNEVEFAALLGL
jgi:DNA ligase (NAD+)